MKDTAFADYKILAEGDMKLTLRGRLETETTASLWRQVVSKLAETQPKMLVIDAQALEYCDGAGIALLLELKRRQDENKGSIQIVGLKPDFEQLMTLFDPGQLSKPERLLPLFRRVPEQAGKALVDLLRDLRSQISFTGEICVKLIDTLFHLGSFC